ncbi:MAG: hypothetical protein A3D44_03825 [Candidatus Staskawiczbacteria bacterium RIFCSPHIGHO2_02_FULL_42_22]|uniref:Uncharacterized protein n=1 Tax=Candidatus Staskawiczbacteria bacterium RIFCSPHIGHO2_02_FULL_42_22 TaxID=1802207 RepID=A0A1G2I447_9BACT|nr:MAG: hypothetical protein A3D44_03825 [Candidatus Staskawiczbacteria bacterium RIFCSPHIGHO2_02_FULL_42_22]
MKNLSIKEKAIYYRKKGYSYNMISSKIEVNKSTLSNWLSGIPFSPNAELIKRIGLAKLKSASFKHNQKISEINEMRELAREELGTLTKRDLWLLGIGLYLGEGTKAFEQIRFSNSNPEMIKVAMVWFREICKLKDENFSLAIHCYPDNNIEETLNYWSRVTGIHEKQFAKIYIDRRDNKSTVKRKTLPYGTMHVCIRSCGEKEFGRMLHRRIMGWIESSLNQVNKLNIT